MIVELNIFFLEEDQYILQESGKPIPLKDCTIKKFGFTTIDYFSPRTDSPEYTIIGSSGNEFVSNESYEAVKFKILQASTFKFN